MATETNNVLDFRDPGAMSEELLSVPGFVNELKNHTLAVAPRPNEPLAFAGALAMLAHLAGRSYVDEGRFDRLKKRFVGLLAKAGGQLDRSTLLKNLNIDSTTFQRIVLTLHMCDAIEEEMLSRRKTIYTLKTAA